MEKQNKKLESVKNFNQDPDLAIFDELQEINEHAEKIAEVLNKLNVEKLEKIQGDKGDNGYSPVKGKDYFTKEEIEKIIKIVQGQIKVPTNEEIIKGVLGKIKIPIPENGVTPVKGQDYFDGETPVKGKDYFTEEEREEFVEKISTSLLKLVPKVDLVEETRKKLEDLYAKDGFDAKFIKNIDLYLPKIVQSQGGQNKGGIWAGSANPFVIKDTGVVKATNVNSINFTGATVTDSNGDVTVAISGGGSSPSIGGTVTSGTSKSVLFINPDSTLAQDNTNFKYTAANQTLQVGSGSTTSIGLVMGPTTDSGYAAIWDTSVTPSTSNYAIRFLGGATNHSTVINAGTTGDVTISINNGNRTNWNNAPGSGPYTTAGTAVADVQAASFTQTWNNAAITFTSLKLNVTDTASNTSSLLQDWQVGSASKANITKGGQFNIKNLGIYSIDNTALGIDFGLDLSNSLTVMGTGGRGITLGVGVTGARTRSTYGYFWSADTDTRTAADTGLSRVGAGIVGIGTGAAGSTAGTLYVGDGASSTPSIAFGSQTNLGFYKAGANLLAVSTSSGNYLRFSVSGSGGLISRSDSPITWASDTSFTTNDTFLTRYAAAKIMISGDGTGTATGQTGWILGNGGTTFSTISQSNDSSNYVIRAGGGALVLQADTSNLASYMSLFATAGKGPTVTSGTSTADNQYGLAITQTLNAAGITSAGIKMNITDTSSNANAKVLEILTGAAGTTSVLNMTKSGALTTGGSIVAGANIQAAAGSLIAFTGRSQFLSPSDGVLLMQNTAGTDFTRLQFGGTTSSFPSIKRNSAGIDFRVADDTAYAAITALTLDLGAATDTTLSRSSAGVLAVEGVVVPTVSSTNTLTNKRSQPRVYTAANNASLTPEIDTYDIFHLTAMSAATTINNHSTSTPADGELMEIRFLDNGTARALTWGTNYVAKAGVPLPTTTISSKNMTCLFEWNANLSKFNLLAVGNEA